MTTRTREPIEIPGLDVAKAKRYSRIKLALLAASVVWEAIGLAWFARGRRAAGIKTVLATRLPDNRLSAPAFFAATTALAWLAGLPTAFLRQWVVERGFGLSRQPLRGWAADQVKGLAVALAVQPLLLTGAWAVIKRRPRDWWLVLAAAAVPLSALFGALAPVLLLPIFNRFTPLRDPALGEGVRALAGAAGVRVADVYAMDMSRQTEKPNAFFTGLGRTKRIVLADTLIERFPPAEVEGIVAHELGHQVHGDIWRLVGVGGLAGFGIARALANLAPAAVRRTSAATGVEEIADEASLPTVALVLMGLGLLATPLQAAFSRAIERRTDRYAVDLTGDGVTYAAALTRLAALSLADPDPPRLVVWALSSHPPIADRIRDARATGT